MERQLLMTLRDRVISVSHSIKPPQVLSPAREKISNHWSKVSPASCPTSQISPAEYHKQCLDFPFCNRAFTWKFTHQYFRGDLFSPLPATLRHKQSLLFIHLHTYVITLTTQVHTVQSHLFWEENITPCIAYIIALHTINSSPFYRKETFDSYYQQISDRYKSSTSQIQISFREKADFYWFR